MAQADQHVLSPQAERIQQGQPIGLVTLRGLQSMADLAAGRLLPRAESWYTGANIPGKPRQLLHHLGVQEYLAHCRESSENGYKGFELR
jgi:hypothetical protein